jgi:hypothetical protein
MENDELCSEGRYKNLDRVNLWIGNCDAKASYLLTLLGVIFTIITTSSYSNELIGTFQYVWSWGNSSSQAVLRFFEALTLYACLVCLLKALNNIYHVLWAKIDAGVYAQQGLASKSVLFFGEIQKSSFVEFSEICKRLNTDELLNQIDSQIYINSKICQLKFDHYNRALKLCRYAFVLVLLFLFLKCYLLRFG